MTVPPLSRRTFGGGPGAYPLPCRRPADDYTSPLAREFVVTAWWPPSISPTEGHAGIDGPGWPSHFINFNPMSCIIYEES